MAFLETLSEYLSQTTGSARSFIRADHTLIQSAVTDTLQGNPESLLPPLRMPPLNGPPTGQFPFQPVRLPSFIKIKPDRTIQLAQQLDSHIAVRKVNGNGDTVVFNLVDSADGSTTGYAKAYVYTQPGVFYDDLQMTRAYYQNVLGLSSQQANEIVQELNSGRIKYLYVRNEGASLTDQAYQASQTRIPFTGAQALPNDLGDFDKYIKVMQENRYDFSVIQQEVMAQIKDYNQTSGKVTGVLRYYDDPNMGNIASKVASPNEIRQYGSALLTGDRVPGYVFLPNSKQFIKVSLIDFSSVCSNSEPMSRATVGYFINWDSYQRKIAKFARTGEIISGAKVEYLANWFDRRIAQLPVGNANRTRLIEAREAFVNKARALKGTVNEVFGGGTVDGIFIAGIIALQADLALNIPLLEGVSANRIMYSADPEYINFLEQQGLSMIYEPPADSAVQQIKFRDFEAMAIRQAVAAIGHTPTFFSFLPQFAASQSLREEAMSPEAQISLDMGKALPSNTHKYMPLPGVTLQALIEKGQVRRIRFTYPDVDSTLESNEVSFRLENGQYIIESASDGINGQGVIVKTRRFLPDTEQMLISRLRGHVSDEEIAQLLEVELTIKPNATNDGLLIFAEKTSNFRANYLRNMVLGLAGDPKQVTALIKVCDSLASL